MADSRTELEQEALVKAQEERTIAHARQLARLAQVFEIGALVLAALGVLAAILYMVEGGRDSVGIGLGIIVVALAIGANLWAAARALRLFGEYVAVRIWRYPRQILAAAVSPPTPGGPSPTPGGSATIPNRS